MALIPDPNALYPIPENPNMVFLRPLLASKEALISKYSVGEFTYYSAFDDPTLFFERNVLYDYGYLNARLDIGKYCSLAHGVCFLMPDANHAFSGPSSYPFPGAWSDQLAVEDVPFPVKGNTTVGHDVWFGLKAVIMPGVSIGSGAVIGAMSVVTKDVAPYSIVAGNPARFVKYRHSDEDIDKLLKLEWWDWSPNAVCEAIPILIKGPIRDLEALNVQQVAFVRRGCNHA